MDKRNEELVRSSISMLGNALEALGLSDHSPCWNNGASYSNDVFAIHAYSWADECPDAPEPQSPIQCDYCENLPEDVRWEPEGCSCPADEAEPVCDDRKCLHCSPCFIHFASGLNADWYKHINRGFEFDASMSAKDIVGIFNECMESLNAPV